MQYRPMDGSLSKLMTPLKTNKYFTRNVRIVSTTAQENKILLGTSYLGCMRVKCQCSPFSSPISCLANGKLVESLKFPLISKWSIFILVAPTTVYKRSEIVTARLLVSKAYDFSKALILRNVNAITNRLIYTQSNQWSPCVYTYILRFSACI